MKWKEYEAKWQKVWEDEKVFVPKADASQPKFFITVPYPYTSGALHIGHGRTYTLGDIIARFRRHQGWNVLFPMGFHISGSPILSISERIAEGDVRTIALYKDYLRIYESDPEKIDRLIDSFKDPKNVADYFAGKISADFKSIGYSIDWTRQFSTGDKEYNRFVEWQYQKLKAAGAIVQGSHPILWSLEGGQPVGEDDIVDGDTDKVSIEEFTMIKFPVDGEFLVASTIRPETIFGVTNLWVNPQGIYLKARVNGEYWLISREAAEKLRAQGKRVEGVKDFRGREIVARLATNPLTGQKIPILPADFVDLDNGTGVVYSVPAHAPYDYQALKDLGNDAHLSSIVPTVFPVIINVPGYSIPAQDLVERAGIRDQKDPALEDLTKELYKTEFYSGVTNSLCREFSGQQVSQVKEKVKAWMIEKKLGEVLYETNRKALTRSKEKVVVSVIENQWFIDYNNSEWKAKTRALLKEMKIFPEKYRKWFFDTVDWLDKRPCARKRGLGTQFPFDREWLIEPLSDSTLYMAFYTIKNRLKGIKPEQLKDELFDFLFLDKGKAEDISEKTKIPLKKIEEMKSEFTYWYPNDLRHTAPAHISNHLTFFLMHHTSVFPRKLWPKAITLNEMLIREGVKMSKSKGNIIPLAHVAEKYGADLYRLYVASSGDFDAVIDWRERDVQAVSSRLEKLVEIAEKSAEAGEEKEGPADTWFIANFEESLKEATKMMEEYRFRDAVVELLFKNLNNFRWLERRSAHPYSTAKKIMSEWLISLAPIIPHTAEEYWKKLGGKGFASLQLWPKPNLVKSECVDEENYVISIIEQVRDVAKLADKKPSIVYIYTADQWKKKAFEIVLKEREKSMKEIGGFENRKEAGEVLQKFIKNRIWEKNLRTIDEEKVLEKAKATLKGELEADIQINSRRDPLEKKAKSMPLRPAVYIE